MVANFKGVPSAVYNIEPSRNYFITIKCVFTFITLQVKSSQIEILLFKILLFKMFIQPRHTYYCDTVVQSLRLLFTHYVEKFNLTIKSKNYVLSINTLKVLSSH